MLQMQEESGDKRPTFPLPPTFSKKHQNIEHVSSNRASPSSQKGNDEQETTAAIMEMFPSQALVNQTLYATCEQQKMVIVLPYKDYMSLPTSSSLFDCVLANMYDLPCDFVQQLETA